MNLIPRRLAFVFHPVRSLITAREFSLFFLWMQQGCSSVYGYLLNIPMQDGGDGKNLPIEKIPQSRPGGNPAMFRLIKRHEHDEERRKLSAHKKRSVVCAYSTFL